MCLAKAKVYERAELSMESDFVIMIHKSILNIVDHLRGTHNNPDLEQSVMVPDQQEPEKAFGMLCYRTLSFP